MEIRFHLDEHVHPGIAIGLRARGIDVTTTFDAGLSGSNDRDQLKFAAREGRVLVTHDCDFLRPHARVADHAGITYCHQQKYSVGQLLQVLYLVQQCYSQEEMLGRVEFL